MLEAQKQQHLRGMRRSLNRAVTSMKEGAAGLTVVCRVTPGSMARESRKRVSPKAIFFWFFRLPSPRIWPSGVSFSPKAFCRP